MSGWPQLDAPVVVRKFSFTYQTAGLFTTGATVAGATGTYTPNAGDVMLDAWVEISIGFNGTSPKFDFGSNGLTAGFFSRATGFGAPAVNNADSVLTGGAITSLGVMDLNESYAAGAVFSGGSQDPRSTPFRFTTATPMKMWVTQSGALGGASPGSTQGVGVLYLVTGSPQ